METADIIGHRYKIIAKLGAGGMGEVFQAHDRLTGETVALKRVTASIDRLDFASQGDFTSPNIALAQEFQVLASLRHPHIVSVLDYGFDHQQQPYYTMTYLEHAQTILDAGCDQSQAFQIQLLIQLLQALAYLHRRGIIHRDLKPANVMVVDGQTQVVDFGLSSVQEHSIEDETQTLTGTLAYMPPESFEGKIPGKSADLYAVGVMAYELFAGQHPFDPSNLALLVNQVLNTPPDMSQLMVDEGIADVVEKLLAKSRTERYQDANQVIQDLCTAANLPLPTETGAIRESFLQAAKFVGREQELSQLKDALDDAVADKGSIWLIAGESGVGKTRLLDELRTLALVKGALVLRGQAITEGGAPYLLWREGLRRLCLQTELSELEASVLKALVPDIGKLIDRSVDDAPMIDPEANRDRLLGVIEGVFRRQKQPIVLVLEDLQWASESLLVLNRLKRTVAELPLLILGSYRDDERPDLPDDIPDVPVMHLGRLAEADISALSVSMLGDAGQDDQVVELIWRETEGNAFFIVEVVRTLAEEAGYMDQIAEMILPVKVFASGIKTIVQRRLSRVPENAHYLLQQAAIAGRELDLDVLRALAINGNLDNWLSICADASVLEVQENRWRFAHDKLREGLLEDLSSEQKSVLHRQVAKTIEHVYPDESTQVAILALHWRQAGDVEKETYYATLAGEQALENGTYREAIRFLERAIELTDQVAMEPLREAKIERMLSETYYTLGDNVGSRVHAYRSLVLLNKPMPVTTWRLAIGLISQILQQVFHRMWTSRFTGQRHGDLEISEEAYLVYGNLIRTAIVEGDNLHIVYSCFRALNIVESAGFPPEILSRGYSAPLLIFGSIPPLYAIGDKYLQMAEKNISQITNSDALARDSESRGMYLLNRGRWHKAEDALQLGAQVAEKIGLLRTADECQGLLAVMGYLRGDFAHSQQLARNVYNSAHLRGDIGAEFWGLCIQAENEARLEPTGYSHQSIGYLQEAESSLSQITLPDIIRFYGVLAESRLHQGELELARQAAETALAKLQFGERPTVIYSFSGYANPPYVYLSLWEMAHDQPTDERKQLRRMSRQACKGLWSFTRVFPTAKPRAHVWQGTFHWLDGNLKKALKHWQKSLDYACQFEMPYEEGLAYYEMGRHLLANDPKRATHLNKAIEIFERLGAAYDLERAKNASQALKKDDF